MPALTAAHHDPHVGGFYLHLQERKKCKMVALVAVLRKLLHAIFGMFKHDQMFVGAKLYCPPEQVSGLTPPRLAEVTAGAA